MRTAQFGFGNNFGLVGKNVRRYMATTALTASSLMAMLSPAFAEGSWSNLDVVEGSATITTPSATQTDIFQHTDFAKAQGNATIYAGDTVNVFQPGSSSIFAVYDITADPTYILGTLNANGRVYVFDQNGVIFGEGSQVNVGSIHASTGYISDANLKEDKLIFEGVNSGVIELNGTISVADAGLAAFVAPQVSNAGIINAKMGKVVLASGEKVTIDLYGDKLVEIAVDGALENALIKNTGTIAAQGGEVVLSAQAAKAAVDDVINLNGVVDVSSVSVEGGKIVLSGGNKGAVKVDGALKADGATKGGSIKVTGEAVTLGEDSVLSADAGSNGDGGNIGIYGSSHAIMGGRASARGGAESGNGGFVELSALEAVGFNGLVDTSAANGETGTFLIDPTTINLGNFSPFDVGTLANLKVDAQALANTLGLSHVHLWATDRIFTSANIDLSRWQIPYIASGITSKNLTLSANTIDILHNVTLGTGKLLLADALTTDSLFGFGLVTPPSNIITNTVNLDGRIYTRSSTAQPAFTTLASDAQIKTTAGTINVLSNKALIQQAIYFADETATDTVINVAAGTYGEAVKVDRTVNLRGANADREGYEMRFDETIIDPLSPGLYVTADDVVINGFTITGATGSDGEGIWVDGADNVSVINNIINFVDQNGIKYTGTTGGGTIAHNKIDNTGRHGISVAGSGVYDIFDNEIGKDGTINGNGIGLSYVSNSKVRDNFIYNTKKYNWDGTNGSGVYVAYGKNNTIEDNYIRNVDWDGVKIFEGDGNKIIKNDIAHAARVGVWAYLTKNVQIIKNLINDTNTTAGIGVEGGSGAYIAWNKVFDTYGSLGTRGDGISVNKTKGDITIIGNLVGDELGGSYINGNGIALYGITGADVLWNKVFNTKKYNWDGTNGSGVYVESGKENTIKGNYIRNVDWDGVKLFEGEDNDVIWNNIAHAARVGVWGYLTKGLDVIGNLIVDTNVTAGIGIEGGSDVNIAWNKVFDTSGDPGSYGDGISVRNTKGTVSITNNLVGDAFGGSYINGNGIALYNIKGAFVGWNSVFNTKKVNWLGTNGSGVYVYNGAENDVVGNFIRNVDWDGVKVDLGRDNYVGKNNIAHSARVGVWGVNTDGIEIAKNWIYDSNVTAGIGVYWSKNAYIHDNFVKDSVGDGIGVHMTTRNVRIEDNWVQDSTDDGIEVSDAKAYVYIAGNKVKNSGFGPEADYYGGDGIHVRNITLTSYAAPQEGDAGNGEYNVVVYDNHVEDSADDGIEIAGGEEAYLAPRALDASYPSVVSDFIGYMGRVLVKDNYVKNSGYGYGEGFGYWDGYGSDGIHVRNAYPENWYSKKYYYGDDDYVTYDISEGGDGYGSYEGGYAVDIIGNKVKNSGDDGIEVLNAYSTYIADNKVRNSGYLIEGYEGEGEEYAKILVDEGYGEDSDTGDTPWGADGIHVRNVWNPAGYESGYDVKVALVDIGDEGDDFYYDRNSVLIIDNKVKNSLDDGIQVLFSGHTDIDGNKVIDSGYGPTRLFGGDGINVVTGITNPLDSYYWSDYIEPVDVNVTNNYVKNSGDDGIEVVGSHSVYVADNKVRNSGDDGINVLGFAGYYGYEGEGGDDYEYGYDEKSDLPHMMVPVRELVTGLVSMR